MKNQKATRDKKYEEALRQKVYKLLQNGASKADIMTAIDTDHCCTALQKYLILHEIHLDERSECDVVC